MFKTLIALRLGDLADANARLPDKGARRQHPTRAFWLRSPFPASAGGMMRDHRPRG